MNKWMNINREKVFFSYNVCIGYLLLVYFSILRTSLYKYMQAKDLKQTHRRLWSVNVHLRRERSIAASACQKSSASAESFHSPNRVFTRRLQSRSKKEMIYFYWIKPGVDASGSSASSVTSHSISTLNHLLTEFSLNIYKPRSFRKLDIGPMVRVLKLCTGIKHDLVWCNTDE